MKNMYRTYVQLLELNEVLQEVTIKLLNEYFYGFIS